MGGSHPSQPRIKPEYTLPFISWIEGAGCFVRCIGLTIRPPHAAAVNKMLKVAYKIPPGVARWERSPALHGDGRQAKGSGLSFLSEDTHNVILDALGLNAAG